VSRPDRVAVLHGVNLDQLGRRDPGHYGALTLPELERKISGFAEELGLHVQFFQTNHEGDFVEYLHKVTGLADALILNPGAWTHYSWAIRDALEITKLPSVEVHLSDVHAREAWRQLSVIRDHCFATIAGKGADGYREALERVRQTLDQEPRGDAAR
jgi:3-dehydroquinate dehydratase II